MREVTDLPEAIDRLITAEGLKERGFRKVSNPDFRNPLEHPCGLMWESRRGKGTMHVIHRRHDPHDSFYMPANPQPQTQGDLSTLMLRMEREGQK